MPEARKWKTMGSERWNSHRSLASGGCQMPTSADHLTGLFPLQRAEDQTSQKKPWFLSSGVGCQAALVVSVLSKNSRKAAVAAGLFFSWSDGVTAGREAGAPLQPGPAPQVLWLLLGPPSQGPAPWPQLKWASAVVRLTGCVLVSGRPFPAAICTTDCTTHLYSVNLALLHVSFGLSLASLLGLMAASTSKAMSFFTPRRRQRTSLAPNRTKPVPCSSGLQRDTSETGYLGHWYNSAAKGLMLGCYEFMN
ncbi:uncharacterized protein LOC110260125 [Sus scrofa]|uniref:uncharacterized protein LOC110260125 n=1 Tax=Sus scrofa TaxID=9823 RepID=UPI000A2B5767|nr:uncharacterized protein LOC110260125 [Sus scrofa]